MPDEAFSEEQATQNEAIQEVVPNEVGAVLVEFDKTFERMYQHYTSEQEKRKTPLPLQNIINYVVDKSLLELNKIYQKVFEGTPNPSLQRKAEEYILDFITNYNKHGIKEEAAVALAKWIGDSTQLRELGILDKAQSSLLATANEMLEIKSEDGSKKLVRKKVEIPESRPILDNRTRV
ncbi:MAG: hypothetical protein QW279_12960 [Candidatus Jordarchaeaceae archaeon]